MVYLPKDRVVITTQHVKNIQTLDKAQNEQVQRLYLQDDEDEDVDESTGDAENAAEAVLTRKEERRRVSRNLERNLPRKRRPGAESSKTAHETDVVNNVMEPNPKNYGEAMRSQYREQREVAMQEELTALEANGVWKVMKQPHGAHVLHTKWVYKTKIDAGEVMERRKTRVVTCGDEQEFGVDYSVTFAAVIDMCSLKLIFALARKWRVPAKHDDVPNSYVKADKEAELVILVRLPHGFKIPEETLKKLGVPSEKELVLELQKALYGLKQAGWRNGDLLVVGVYVEDLLVTGTRQKAVDAFFVELSDLVVKDLGTANKFLGMRVEYTDEEGYYLNQAAAITELL
ncbi:putative mitochondrial protein [Phytophthora megakarya]|uniref:Putative mitochondrial protein n=1 Tax=Phytophthora megakarya TaxID=4795 RepID=A0A225WB39_9STRA|nr:putative mitochondrial protein [Phytophthora megakarya]